MVICRRIKRGGQVKDVLRERCVRFGKISSVSCKLNIMRAAGLPFTFFECPSIRNRYVKSIVCLYDLLPICGGERIIIFAATIRRIGRR